ncbi:hypothetical protein CBR_g8271 [Chara braunii]|uniref:Uncharacterized protein n=1 Tax=Chara braunii TaxID=69332 RepID=A0A388KLP9_CHABU|nr:hypothetical protein CBR_g8271 [Chara braunii]|eukprot:GBG70971.1 hypothetical protein CBR_g8271 [Chara braunii]
MSSLCCCWCSICRAAASAEGFGVRDARPHFDGGVISPRAGMADPAKTVEGQFPAFAVNGGEGGNFPAQNAWDGDLAKYGTTSPTSRRRRRHESAAAAAGIASGSGIGGRNLLQAPSTTDPKMGSMPITPNTRVPVQTVFGAIAQRYYFEVPENATSVLTIEARSNQGGCGLYVFGPAQSTPKSAPNAQGFAWPGKVSYTWKSDDPASNFEMVYVNYTDTVKGVYTVSLVGRSAIENLCELSVLLVPAKTEINSLQKQTIASFFDTCCPASMQGANVCPNVMAAGGPDDVNPVMNKQNLTCAFPSAEIAKLGSLQWLELRNNSISGTVDWALLANSLQNISRVDLAYNQIGGVISCDLQKRALEHLDLGHNQFEGPLPMCLAGVAGVGVFNVGNNRLNGSILDSNKTTKLAPTLRRFVISSNEIEGSLTQDWGALKDLIVLRVDNNQLTGDIPGNLFQPALVELDITNNNFTGVLPRNLSAAQKIEVLALGHNPSLRGNLPPNITGVSNLLSLSFENTSISGELPTQWSTLWLTQVVAYKTKLTGPLPSSLIGLPSLKRVELQENEMSGPLPLLPTPQLPRFNGILYLNLSQNSFSGTFPESWSDLPLFDPQRNPLRLGDSIYPYVLDVSFNQLSGPIPQFLYPESTPSWTSLFLQGNNFTCEEVVYDTKSKVVGGVACQEQQALRPSDFARLRVSRALVVGVVIAGLAVAVFIVVLAVLLVRRRRRTTVSYGRFSNL